MLLSLDTLDFAAKDYWFTYDIEPIEQAIDLNTILLADDTSPVQYCIISDDINGKTLILINIPRFSEHVITIQKIIEVLTGPVALAIYAVVAVVALVLFSVSMINAPYRRRYFRKRQR